MGSSNLRLLLFFLIAFAPGFALSQVLFQGFSWESWKKEGGLYNSLKGSAPDLAASGITHVWLPPASQAASNEGESNG
uniref:Alpha-amylase n=1 Tax=Kalanchoe fedtschenkoi TaxID=63787 RepID=A0A7N0V915_KALFE